MKASCLSKMLSVLVNFEAYRVLEEFRRNEQSCLDPHTLSRRTGLSEHSVSLICAKLHELGIIEEKQNDSLDGRVVHIVTLNFRLTEDARENWTVIRSYLSELMNGQVT